MCIEKSRFRTSDEISYFNIRFEIGKSFLLSTYNYKENEPMNNVRVYMT